MSVGSPVEIYDNNNKPCMSIDLVVHPVVIENLNKD